MKPAVSRSFGAYGGQSGLSLIEMMIALAITMALSAGMLSLLMNTRGSSKAQTQLEQLQEDQRLALIRLTDTVQNASYFPNPQTSAASIELPATAQFATAGQGLVGTSSAAAPGDSILVRYEAGTTDGVMDCTGKTNTTAAPLVMVNSFSIDAYGNFNCSVNGSTLTLAAGVSNIKVLYGVDTNLDGAADQYIPASAMTAANWSNIESVSITVTFSNPLAGQPGQSSTLAPITQIIPVLNQI